MSFTFPHIKSWVFNLRVGGWQDKKKICLAIAKEKKSRGKKIKLSMHSKGQGGWQACTFCKKKRVSLYNIGLEGDIIVFVLRYEIVLTQIELNIHIFLIIRNHKISIWNWKLNSYLNSIHLLKWKLILSTHVQDMPHMYFNNHN